jgi:hypothetical protein
VIHFARSAAVTSDATTATDERRRSPRVELLGRLHGHSVSLDLPVRVVQISLGGMAIETTVPFPAGAVHLFRLTLGDDSTTELTGKVMHSRNTAPVGATPVFTTGVQFVEGDTEGASGVVDDILNRNR